MDAHLKSIETSLSTAKLEAAKLGGGCKASAARTRGALLDIQKACFEARKSALEMGKSIQPKKRAEKKEEVKPTEPAAKKVELKKEAAVVAEPLKVDLPLDQPVLVRQDAVAPKKQRGRPAAAK
jgi:hypothetical protein